MLSTPAEAYRRAGCSRFSSCPIANEREGEYDAYLAAFLGRLERFVQDADPTRESMIVLCYDPVTNVRKGFHQAELIGYNKYIGWYEGELGDLQGFLDRYRSSSYKQ